MLDSMMTLTHSCTELNHKSNGNKNDGEEAFDQFIVSFEDYCTRTYPGTSEKMLHLLGSILGRASIASLSNYSKIYIQL